MRQRWTGPARAARKTSASGLARTCGCSIPEIHKSSLNQPLNDGKDHGRRDTEHEHPICCFQRSQQSPRRCHYHITVTKGRVVHSGVIECGSELRKFTADHEQYRPHRHRNDRNIDPVACACSAEFSLAANEGYSPAQGERVDHDCTDNGACASCQWNQDRDSFCLHPTKSALRPTGPRLRPQAALRPRFHRVACQGQGGTTSYPRSGAMMPIFGVEAQAPKNPHEAVSKARDGQ
jgi:hypothetical protein